MSKFSISKNSLNAMEKKVISALGNEKVSEYASVKVEHGLLCGCGAGGNCASSCVSGCAERG